MKRNLPRKGPVKKKKKIKTSTLAKALEVLQKQYVIKVYGNDCYTCPAKNLQGSNCQLGHVPWARSELSTICKFDHRYTRIQCYSCNIWKHGRGADALLRMMKEDINVVELAALNLATKGKTCNPKWYLEAMNSYKEKLL